MGDTIRFTISGMPMGKERDRFLTSGQSYTPETTRDYEKLVKVTCSEKCALRKPDYPGQVAVDITAYYPLPAASTKAPTAQIRNGTRPIEKPDLDNIAKIIMDALNHVAWQDDRQVVCMVLSKKYAEVPCVSVGVHYLE